MSIQFGGIGSGLPVQDWIDAIIQAESNRLNSLKTKKYAVQNSKTALNTVESKFSSLRSSVEKLTDANLASVFDLFERKKITSSDTDKDIATATVSTNAAVQKIDLDAEPAGVGTGQRVLAHGQVGAAGVGDAEHVAHGRIVDTHGAEVVARGVDVEDRRRWAVLARADEVDGRDVGELIAVHL